MAQDIPIVIICYNNYRYVENTLSQILRINKEYYKNIIILNNASTCEDTIGYLRGLGSGDSSSGSSDSSISIINNIGNFGPWIAADNNSHIYNILPNKFILTDPDLKLNENIPSNFVDILATLSDKYKTTKIGLALDITDSDKFYQTAEYMANLSIYDWEKRFWIDRIEDADYVLYKADIDTTFCLINKDNVANASGAASAANAANAYLQIRVAGNFTAKHIPWYIDNEVYNIYDNYSACINTTHISTIARIVKPFVEDNYLRIYKNGELFLIKNSDVSPFWRDVYGGWDNEMFEVFDKYLSKDKVFIDIGNWITPTSLYATRKSKYVYGIEYGDAADTSFASIMKDNCANNYKRAAVAASADIETLIQDALVAATAISLIRLDIDGKEEDMLSDLYNIHIKYGATLFIKFNYSKWNDKNLDRFQFLTQKAKDIIKAYSSCYILF
jgi:hypothetical protein